MIRIFKIIALLEGSSLLLLLLFAMPMKYIFHDPIYVKIIGMGHGVLFVLYILMAIVLKFKVNWNLSTFGIVCIASVIPFGTFYIEKKYLKNA